MADNILVVDDEAEIADLLELYLKNENYTVFKYYSPKSSVTQADIEKAVIESVKVYAAALIEREELKLSAIQQTKQSCTEIEGRIKAEEKAVRLLEDFITKNFTALV